MTTQPETPLQSYVPSTTTTAIPQQYIPVAPPQRYFTEDDLNKARQDEKDKLYQRLENQQKQIDSFTETVNSLKAAEDSRNAELERQRKAAEDAKRAAEEEKLTARELVEAQKAEFTKQQDQIRQEMELKITTMQKEQEFLKLRSYTQRRVAEEIASTNIIPDLAEYITGNSEEEVEAAIERAKVKTESIVRGAQSLTARVPAGVSPSAGPSGPLDAISGPRQLSRDDIANMSMAEYAKYRQQTGLDRRGNGQGLFS